MGLVTSFTGSTHPVLAGGKDCGTSELDLRNGDEPHDERP
jgi:hypothetical protein